VGILTWLFGIRPDGPGVYRIRNRKNNKVYIGSTRRTIRVRLQEHVEDLHAGVHHNHLLQADWIAYGQRAFAFEVMEAVDNDVQMESRELYWQRRIPEGKSYVLQIAQPARRRRGGFFMPVNIAYTDNMPLPDLLYALAWAVYDDGAFVFEIDPNICALFDKRAKEAVIKIATAYRKAARPPVAPVTHDWTIRLLALQRNVTTPTPIPLP
jgi:GIY-YIG catalytic domain